MNLLNLALTGLQNSIHVAERQKKYISIKDFLIVSAIMFSLFFTDSKRKPRAIFFNPKNINV